jgi:hypothetical protein
LVNLTESQWALLGDIDKILKPFMLAQELLEGEKYVTLSLVVSIIEKIRKNLKEELRNTEHSEYVTSMLKVLLQVFTAEWGSGDKNTQYDEHFTTYVQGTEIATRDTVSFTCLPHSWIRGLNC